MIAAILCGWFQLPAQTAAPAFQSLEFLLGDWTGVTAPGDTPLGAGQGAFSFEAQLNRKIIVRKNHSIYDSGAKHDDLMIIYFDGPKQAPRAVYFDTEGHVIRYDIAAPSANRAVFESDPAEPGPRYRLTYWMEKEKLNGRFEVASPGSGYKPYLTWTSKKS